jgi:hypothetical protein
MGGSILSSDDHVLTVAATPTSSSWGFTQPGQGTTNPHPFSLQEPRPPSTSAYSSASMQSFERGGGTPWQTANLDPSDFPALGSGTSSVSHGPPSTQSYASTAGTGAVQQQRLQQIYGRQGANEDPFNVSASFSPDEFPALGGMGDGHSQRMPHLGGQSNGYDPRQQGDMMTPPNLSGSQSLQANQDHRASMLEALQQGQRAPPRTGGTPSMMSSSIFEAW